ncbi:magnesium transporter [Halobacterium sp. KA-4]|uniref:magnesium transporter n=1 Tax=Halobacterium sp. KA-4 TaxID=2896367 RepID=UPI001E47FCD9|nr:magnesium transporter [Halobacterium sp. KA-4]MCD2200618.1 magnesium transporter [Halobacterium sp. KA-4]
MTIRAVAEDAYREAFGILVLSAVASVFSGVVLGGMERELTVVPGLLTIVPALLATRGSVYGSLGARLATGLHQGLVEPDLGVPGERVRSAVAAAMLNGVVISAVAAAAGYGIRVALDLPVAPLSALLVVALVAGVLSGAGLTLVVIVTVFVGFRRGLNPDALAGPVVTTTGDVIGIATMLAGARLAIAAGVV